MLRITLAAVLIASSAVAYADSIEEKAKACGACHGASGLPEGPEVPIIWGQNEGYLYLQLRDFQKGARKDDQMSAIARTISKEDTIKLAEYFAAKPWPKINAASASKAGNRDRKRGN